MDALFMLPIQQASLRTIFRLEGFFVIMCNQGLSIFSSIGASLPRSQALFRRNRSMSLRIIGRFLSRSTGGEPVRNHTWTWLRLMLKRRMFWERFAFHWTAWDIETSGS